MDCQKAEILIMQHFEKTIKPANASKLAKHVLTCELCRELYVTLDEAMDFANTTNEELTPAPESFTNSVMAMVRAEEPYAKAVLVTAEAASQMEVTITKPETGGVILRIIWGFSAILLGVVMLFIFDPDLFYSVAGGYPIMEILADGLASAALFFDNAADWFIQGASFSAEYMGITALLFVAVMGTLLFVLHSGEKVQT